MNDLFDKTDFDKEFEQLKGWLKHSFGSIHTGRPKPEMIESLPIEVSAYGGQAMELKSLTTIEILDGKFRLQPWDKSTMKDIENALRKANTGMSIEPHESEIFISVPPLTEETRQKKVKEVNSLLEDARVRVRKLRHDYIDLVEAEENASEDDQDKAKRDIQDAVDEANKELEAMAKAKEHELLTI